MISSVKKEMEQMKFSSTADETETWTNHVRKLVLSTKTEAINTLWSSNSTSTYILNRNAKIIYKNVYSSITYNSQKLEITPMSIDY